MGGFGRREASKIIGLGMLSPVFLKADGTPDVESPSADYEPIRNKCGSIQMGSKKNDAKDVQPATCVLKFGSNDRFS